MKILKPLFFCPLIFLAIAVIIVSCQSQKIVTNTKTENSADVDTKLDVRENERGVLFRRFANGVDTTKVFLPGKYAIYSFDRLLIYNIDSKAAIGAFSLLSKDEISIEVNIKYSYKPIPEKVAHLHYYVGTSYHDYAVRPQIEMVIKAYFKNYMAADISLSGKLRFEDELLSMAKKTLAEKYLALESIQIAGFTYP